MKWYNWIKGQRCLRIMDLSDFERHSKHWHTLVANLLFVQMILKDRFPRNFPKYTVVCTASMNSAGPLKCKGH